MPRMRWLGGEGLVIERPCRWRLDDRSDPEHCSVVARRGHLKQEYEATACTGAGRATQE